jgi:deoxyribose-phosphate aldolase
MQNLWYSIAMNDAYIYKHVDHTLLIATASQVEIDKLCREAIEYKTASVCVPPHYVKYIRTKYPELVICTVVGFPLGYHSISTKAVELQTALEESAEEFDMVINLADVKNKEFETIQTEITVLKHILGTRILKVIIETCYLTEEEKIKMCEIVTNSGADYIKTSTGFGTAGATMADIELFKKYIGENVKIKAAGGIKTREDMVEYLNAGCDRLGTSSAVKILTGDNKTNGY